MLYKEWGKLPRACCHFICSGGWLTRWWLFIPSEDHTSGSQGIPPRCCPHCYTSNSFFNLIFGENDSSTVIFRAPNQLCYTDIIWRKGTYWTLQKNNSESYLTHPIHGCTFTRNYNFHIHATSGEICEWTVWAQLCWHPSLQLKDQLHQLVAAANCYLLVAQPLNRSNNTHFAM